MNIPCKDCITFAICKAQAVDYSTCPGRLSHSSLAVKCSLYRMYCNQGYYKTRARDNESSEAYELFVRGIRK